MGIQQSKTTTRPYTVACYYFGNYHIDPRNEAQHGPGWTEWELVQRATPRFPGHQQPKVPFWGYEDESDPQVMAKKIDAAANHGINTFLFDWYWYNDGPFLQRALEQGFLKAANNNRMEFALMWANHTWIDIHPTKRSNQPAVQFPGQVTRQTFDQLTGYIIENYFKHPSYWLIDGCPYFSIYTLSTLMSGLGGVTGARAALDSFRARTKAAGFPDLHLNAVCWDLNLLPGETAVKDAPGLVARLGLDSLTSYVWIHHVPLDKFPETPYTEVMEKAVAHWQETAAKFTVPYYPNVTMGWDSSPRTVQSDRFCNNGYPFMATIGENTPCNFKKALQQVKEFLDKRPLEQRIFNINAWNEWTEGSYLEPDTVNGTGYLEAIREVFG